MNATNSTCRALFVALMFSMIPAYAADEMTEAKKWAEEQRKDKVDNAAQTTDPGSVPGSQGQDVPENEYVNDGGAIEDRAEVRYTTDENAQFIQNSSNTRPILEITPDNPVLQNQAEIEQRANAITTTYTGCTDLPVGDPNVTTTTEEFCGVDGVAGSPYQHCTRHLTFSCPSGEDPHGGVCTSEKLALVPPLPAGVTASLSDADTTLTVDGTGLWGPKCFMATRTIKFTVTDPTKIESFVLGQVKFRGLIEVTLNGSFVYYDDSFIDIEPDPDGPGDLPWCGGAKYVETTVNSEHKPLLVAGVNTLTITTIGKFSNAIYLQFHADSPVTETVTEVCPDGFSPGGMTPTAVSCIGGPETRLIDGVPVYRDCWDWDVLYTVTPAPIYTEEATCQTLRDMGCTQTSTVCDVMGDGFCEHQTLGFTCSHTAPERTVSLCGSSMYCPDGNCGSEYQTYDTTEEQFTNAISQLSAAAQVATEFDHEKLTVFTGKPMECQKDRFGFADCCADDGWGIDSGLAKCSSEEKQLGKAKEAKRTHYIGSYKDGPWYNEKKYKVYCVYSSKLGRILIEQGNAQLGKGYGTPKHPKCDGFTKEELQALDFNQMDLSEYYADVEQGAADSTRPGLAELLEAARARAAEQGGGN